MLGRAFRLVVGGAVCMLAACGDGGGAPSDGDGSWTTAGLVVAGHLRTYDNQYSNAVGAHVYLNTDSIFFNIVVQDTVAGVKWVGFELSGPTSYVDSIAVPDSMAKGPLILPVVLVPDRPQLNAELTIKGFARNSRDRRVTVALDGNPALLVAPQETLYPQAGWGSYEVAMDLRGPDRRRRTFWAMRTEIARDDGTGFVGPLLPAEVQSVDIMMNPDSLIVTLPSRDAYAIVELRFQGNDYVAPTIVPDTITAVDGTPWALRVAANGHVIVHRRHPTDPAQDSYVDYDPATGVQRLVSEVVPRGRMDRSLDHARIIVWDTVCCAGKAQVYTSATGSWSAPRTIGVAGLTPVTMDTMGATLLAGTTLYALPDLAPILQFQPPHLIGGTVLSPNGQAMIAVTKAGFLRVWTDNLAADLIPLTSYKPEPLVHLPDLNELLVSGSEPQGGFHFGAILPFNEHVVQASAAIKTDRHGVASLSARASPLGSMRSLPRPLSRLLVRMP